MKHRCCTGSSKRWTRQTTCRTSSSTAPVSYTPMTSSPSGRGRHLDIDVMRRVFDVNALGVGLLGKHLIPSLRA